ncbi:DNA primase [Cognatishimia sp. F0-27]|uniref:DNA primase n=1 Tax=Cognatishimia sp. F0-27 TaxID=2816855 RepID=UPI001D0C1C3F|nr:DNA primase [Cognatishimia sp. F0-27]MCC1491728.1 DNA primase [Cognatishimia sp. F0-27]
MALPPGFLDELRTRTSLTQVVGRKVMWDQRKSNQGKGDMWAPCPFHHEKTASFHVDDRKGFYHCFGCQASGDAIKFIRETENVGFMEAVEILATEAGMEMPAADPRAKEKTDRLSVLAGVMEKALGFYRMSLKQQGGAAARAYLSKRGLSAEAVDRWELGFAPDAWEALREHLTASGVPVEDMLECGLLKASNKGRAPYDVFRNRILFPIRDGQGRLVGFGGRAMDPDDNAKYLNSPETPLFDKSRMLYNLKPARAAAGRQGPLIVAEGYMDVIALSEAGFPAAVAPLGTAVTEQQLQLMWRVSPEPVVMLDGDSAGLRAAYRVIGRALPLLEAGKSLRFAILPDGKDPDDLLRDEGPDALQAVLDAAIPMVKLLWREETEGRVFDSPERRAALDKTLRERLKSIKDPSLRHHYGEALKELRHALFRPASAAGRPSGGGAFTPRRWGEKGWRMAPVAPTPGAKTSVLVTQEAPEAALREAVVLAAILSAPDIAMDFEADLEALDCSAPGHAALRDAILDAIGAEEAMHSCVAERIGASALESFLSQRHLLVIPCLRRRGDAELARSTVTEALAKLASDRGWQAELEEAEEDLADAAPETSEALTWRLGQAAQARNRAGRREGEDDTDYEIGPNGAPIDKSERSAFDSLLEQIRFEKGRK